MEKLIDKTSKCEIWLDRSDVNKGLETPKKPDEKPLRDVLIAKGIISESDLK